MESETRRITGLNTLRGAIENIPVPDGRWHSDRRPRLTRIEKLHIKPGVIHPPEKHKCSNNAPADKTQAILISCPLKGILQLFIPIQVTQPQLKKRNDAILVSSLFAK
jgi:hypothetical protein